MNKKTIDHYYFEIAANALNLRERIEALQNSSVFIWDEAKSAQRIDEWQKVVAPDNPGMFGLRLKNDHLNMAGLKKITGTLAITNDNQLPAWIYPFREIMDFLKNYMVSENISEIHRLFGKDQENQIPFLHLITPLVLYAEKKLEIAVGDNRSRLLSNEANEMLNRQLAGALNLFAAQTFHLEFQVFLSSAISPFTRLFDQVIPEKKAGNELYLEFIQKIFENHWLDFFAEYSALARIITTLIINWINNSALFINRLANDFEEITAHFNGNIPPGKLVSYKGGISDRHHHGKGVISLQFQTGLKLIYKPKNLELEQAWSELTGWLNEAGLKPGLKPLDVVNKVEYGWVGFIEAAECGSEKEVPEYYQRIGILAGIIYLLHGNDFHKENIIASGAWPVLIDLESVMHHEGKLWPGDVAENAMFMANEQITTSVLRTGLLPMWIPGKDGFLFDVSGIGAYENMASPYQGLQWENINTNKMNFRLVNMQMQAMQNLPVFNGDIQLPSKFINDIISGFTSFYKFVMAHHHEIPIQLFAGKELRFIFRATRVYGLIMKQMMNPMYMRNGFDRSIQFDLLAKAFLNDYESSPYWPVFISEVQQMEEVDYPIFWADADKVNLKDHRGLVHSNFMQEAVYDKVIRRLHGFNENDFAVQVRFIRAALHFKDAVHRQPAQTDEKMISYPQNAETADPEILLDSALKIAKTLKNEALFSKDGSCTWISAGLIPETERFRMQPMSLFLYDGLSGVVLFLSALHSITHDPEIQMLNNAGIRSLRLGIHYLVKNRNKQIPGLMGIASGIPSIIYTLLKISEFLNDSSFVDDALELEKVITPSIISNDRNFDILSGSAGCILALLLLHKHTGQNGLPEKAIACGNHLVENLANDANGNSGWKTHGGLMLTGFSHGQAGIAFSLVKLYEATGNEKYREAAEKAIVYENSLFSPEHKNWPDLRHYTYQKNTGAQFMNSWCHGAPGIGIARMGVQPWLNSPQTENDIQNALSTTGKTPVSGRDHLCCGNLGRIDIMLSAALKRKDDELLKTAYQQVQQVLNRKGVNGHFTLFSDPIEGFYNPGFFQGMSGIGYELIRLAYPEKLPSVLAFE